MLKSRKMLLSAVALVAVVSASCGSDSKKSVATTPPVTAAATTPPAGTTGASGEVVVFAAASLTGAFTEIGDAFMVEHPDVKVTFSFAASSELVSQIGQGSPADVFASADQSNMKKLTDAGNNASAPVVFAKNRAAIIVGAGNPKGIKSVSDLTRSDLTVVQCAPEVPCGKYAAQIFAKAGITVTPKSLEQNVKAVVSKVTLGEADAGIVYVTDVTAAGDKAVGVTIPDDLNVIAEYPIAVTKEAGNPKGAADFVAFVSSEQGQKILGSYGFLKP